MIHLETHSTDACLNFAAEYFYAAENPPEDTLFLFWRTEPTLMIGRYQNALEEIDKSYADRRGIRVVRRLSGGGTIYTDLGGWQYSFIAPGGGEIEFTRFLQPVLSALRDLGVPAEFNGRNDLVVEGKKFSGTAQYRLGGRVVHHGSLLFDTDLEEMARATTVNPEKIISKGIRSVRDRVTNLREYLPSPLSAEAFRERMVAAILGDGEKKSPSPGEWLRIRQIAREKFENWQAVYAASPRFAISRARRFPGGRVEFLLNVERGVIREIEMRGDFFAGEAVKEIPLRLQGVPYERDAVGRALAGLEGVLYQISPEELAETLVD